MKTVYLVVKNLGGVIHQTVVPLINQRNGHLQTFEKIVLGDTWGKMKTSFEDSAKEKGRGSEIVKFKDGLPYWVLPYQETTEQITINQDDAVILLSQELNAFGWDEIID
tara:strand:- start:3532 stop:3858 length:327 start_codon:yes stop_codon:yes gene_type:complete